MSMSQAIAARLEATPKPARAPGYWGMVHWR